MAALSHLAALDSVALAFPGPLNQDQIRALAWADCLLRADYAHPKRVKQCNAALRAAFGISL